MGYADVGADGGVEEVEDPEGGDDAEVEFAGEEGGQRGEVAMGRRGRRTGTPALPAQWGSLGWVLEQERRC